MDPFIGEIRLVAFNFEPEGWAFCDGRLLPIAQNQALFSLLGTTYGGDGRTTFALPDLRGRSPVGMGTGPGLSPVTQGERVGQETVTLTNSQLPAHNHQLAGHNIPVTVGGQIAVPVSTSNAESAAPAGAVPAAASSGGRPFNLYNASPTGSDTLAPFQVSLNGTASTPDSPTSTTGGNQPFDCRAPGLGMNYIIALDGFFPSRN